MDISQIEALEKLNALKEKGVLSDEEFSKQKEAVLNKKVESTTAKPVLAESPDRNIFQCYADCFRKYFQFSGRSSRYEYWSFYLINTLISLVLSIPVFAAVSVIYSLAAFIPGLAVCVRRMHDINKSGWKLFAPIGIFFLVFVVLATISAIAEYANAASDSFRNMKSVVFVFLGIGVIALAGVYLYWMLKKGDDKENKYGPAPFVEQKKHRTVVYTAFALVFIIPIILVILASAFAGASVAHEKFKLNKTVDQITLISTNIQTLFSTQSSYNGLDTNTAVYYGAIPVDMLNENKTGLVNPYGGEVAIVGQDEFFAVVYGNVPNGDCKVLEHMDWAPNSDSYYAVCEDCAHERCTFRLVSY